MAIRGILWDIDDTVFDYSGAEAHALAVYLADKGLLDRFGPADQAMARWRAVMVAAYTRFLAGELTFTEQRRARVREFLGEPLDDDAADAWTDGYTTRYEQAWRIFPDVLPVLDALADTHRHGLLSNSSEPYQDRKLRILGIRDRFDCLLCSEEVGAAKPDPVIFLAGCEALGLPPGEVAYVGDRLDLDALGAQSAGLHGVWLDRDDTGFDGEPPPGVSRLTGLAGLPAVLERAGHGGAAADEPKSRFGAAPPIG